MSMSKKDYVKVANIIHTAIQESDPSYDAWVEIGMRLADMFAADNPRFDRDRFYEAADLS
jgi:hypothetical protein